MRRVGATACIGRIISRQESGFDTARVRTARVRTGANIVLFKANCRENVRAEGHDYGGSFARLQISPPAKGQASMAESLITAKVFRDPRDQERPAH